MSGATDISPESLSGLIGRIYDAALDSTLWPEVLRQAAAFAGAQGAGLLSKGLINRAGSVHFQVGVEPRFIALYETEFFRYDPISPLSMFAVGEVTARADYIEDAEFAEGRFHREWAAPQGWIDAANVVIEKSAAVFSLLSLLRSVEAGRVDDEMRRRVRLIFPHIRRAVLIGQAIDLKTVEAAQLADALDALSAAMFLLGADGQVVHANRAGHDLAGGAVVSLAGGRLAAHDAAAQRQLESALAAAAAGDGQMGEEGVAIAFAGGGKDRHVGHLLPLGAGTRVVVGRNPPVAALFIRRAGMPQQSSADIVARAYGLTPGEVRILMALGQADGVSAIAAALGIAENTVSSHLGHLFAKTGRRTQAGLVRLLAEHASPVHG